MVLLHFSICRVGSAKKSNSAISRRCNTTIGECLTDEGEGGEEFLMESKTIISSARDSFKFLTKYLAIFSGEDAYNIGEAKEEAVRTIIEFVKAPDMFHCDLLDMPAVAQLEKDAKYASVYQLLKIFLTQRLDAYLDFYAANSTLLKSYGLVHEDCLVKMRLMQLVNDDEVEMWVVKAITAKLIDCNMDQMNQIVIVSRCTERIFVKHQWQTHREKLATWRGNITNVISTIQANKITEDATQAVQGLMIR
ncbi:Eukaryotic translation initiation factor 3 subunit M [Camellia lanceoleosa]|uniref:Eukaryotic translation initiation factor 3 subunit M n=1 Tax=Camellia lanceoleosa TaxID=1840588 RepID=A0ACC0IVR6_9ERIC|nr:Eukaryotic translation initiation factor 3 subunit M [Camellia lanceoleosa]